MIGLDQYIFTFISGNWFTITLALGVLKIISKATSWVVDDQIHTLLAGTFRMIKKPVAGGIPSMEERGEEVESH